MSGDRSHADHLDDPTRPDVHAPAAPETAAPGLATVARLAAPDATGGTAAAASGLMALQRTAGNAAVTSMLAPAVQRSVTIDEIDTTVDAPDADVEPSPAAGGGGDGGAVTSSGGQTTITGAQITLDAAMVSTPGVLRTGTIIADNVIGSNYTPGAGNVW